MCKSHPGGTGFEGMKGSQRATKGMAGEVTQTLGGAQKIVSWIPDIGLLEFNLLL
jgi:hypothetical protein